MSSLTEQLTDLTLKCSLGNTGFFKLVVMANVEHCWNIKILEFSAVTEKCLSVVAEEFLQSS
jgi:hypothetical protein